MSVFGRYSSLFYTPGSGQGNDLGDLLYNGISQTAYKRDDAYGTQDEGACIWAITLCALASFMRPTI